MANTTFLASYLFARLQQLGVQAIHGVPGDYNLELLDFILPDQLWVGNVNELNAGYAADGYARIKGLAALITTFGVGELSAMNAIAGAYAERAPVVHIVGSPSRARQDAREQIHHTFNDGNFERFRNMYSSITVAQVSLRDMSTAPCEIDRVLLQCLIDSRPVYIEVPMDVVGAVVPSQGLEKPIVLPQPLPHPRNKDLLQNILSRLYTSKKPLIIVDGESRPMGVLAAIEKLIQALGWPVWTTPFGKGLVDEELEIFQGVYCGSYDEVGVEQYFKTADLILCFGPHWSSSNTYGYTATPRVENTIIFTDMQIKAIDFVIQDISAQFAITYMLEHLDATQLCTVNGSKLKSISRAIGETAAAKDEPLNHLHLWSEFSSFVSPGDIILGETGTAGYGVRQLHLPRGTRLFAPATWLSIGYMLPAAQGAALAQRELLALVANARQYCNTILFIGDGSFQMTVQELSTIIRHKLDVVVFLLNNNGYTIERAIHGLHAAYNAIASWRYLDAPALFGSDRDTFTATARTFGELERVLQDQKLVKGRGLRMVELILDPEDVPDGPLSAYLTEERRRVQEEGVQQRRDIS